MTKQQWRTESIRINPTTRRAIALQGRFPITIDEWDQFMNKLDQLRIELVEEQPEWCGLCGEPITTDEAPGHCQNCKENP